MQKNFLYISAVCLNLLLLGACSTTRKLSSQATNERDSIHIEYRERIVSVPDTVFVEIPAQTAERTTPDSTSHLENDYSESDARINPDGTLFHSLSTKPQMKPVSFKKQIEYRDSIIYQDRWRTRTKTVVKENKLSWFQKTLIGGCSGLLLFVVITYTIKIIRTHIR